MYANQLVELQKYFLNESVKEIEVERVLLFIMVNQGSEIPFIAQINSQNFYLFIH